MMSPAEHETALLQRYAGLVLQLPEREEASESESRWIDAKLLLVEMGRIQEEIVSLRKRLTSLES